MFELTVPILAPLLAHNMTYPSFVLQSHYAVLMQYMPLQDTRQDFVRKKQ